PAGCQWCEIRRSGQPSPVKSATAALKDQSFGPVMPAVAAWSVIVTGTGVPGGGVFGGGLGGGPTPGAAGTRGTGGGGRGRRKDRPGGTARVFDGGLGAQPAHQGDHRPRRVGREADELVVGRAGVGRHYGRPRGPVEMHHERLVALFAGVVIAASRP